MTAKSTLARFTPALLLLLALALPTHAQTVRPAVSVIFHAGPPDISFSAAGFADAAVRRSLSHGLMQTLVTRVLASGTDGRPIAASVRSCHVVYDIWADRYSVDVRTETSDRSLTLPTIEAVVQTCLVADHVVVGDAAAWSGRHGQHVRFDVVVELNPVTPDMVERIRGWLARPEGGAARDEAFFGSFVSLFVTRQIGDAERSLAFGSGELSCP